MKSNYIVLYSLSCKNTQSHRHPCFDSLELHFRWITRFDHNWFMQHLALFLAENLSLLWGRGCSDRTTWSLFHMSICENCIHFSLCEWKTRSKRNVIVFCFENWMVLWCKICYWYLLSFLILQDSFFLEFFFVLSLFNFACFLFFTALDDVVILCMPFLYVFFSSAPCPNSCL